jgi:hypothetical protein
LVDFPFSSRVSDQKGETNRMTMNRRVLIAALLLLNVCAVAAIALIGLPWLGPGAWMPSTLGGAVDTCPGDMICAEFLALDGSGSLMAPCCIAPENLGSDNPYHCVELYSPATERDDREE